MTLAGEDAPETKFLQMVQVKHVVTGLMHFVRIGKNWTLKVFLCVVALLRSDNQALYLQFQALKMLHVLANLGGFDFVIQD